MLIISPHRLRASVWCECRPLLPDKEFIHTIFKFVTLKGCEYDTLLGNKTALEITKQITFITKIKYILKDKIIRLTLMFTESVVLGDTVA